MELVEARDASRERLATAFGLACLPNVLDAIGVGSDAWWWLAVRITLSAVFVLTLGLWLGAELRARRARGGQAN